MLLLRERSPLSLHDAFHLLEFSSVAGLRFEDVQVAQAVDRAHVVGMLSLEAVEVESGLFSVVVHVLDAITGDAGLDQVPHLADF